MPSRERDYKNKRRQSYPSEVDDEVGATKSELTLPSSQRMRTKEPSLIWALAKTFGATVIMAGIFKLLRDVLTFVSPQLLK